MAVMTVYRRRRATVLLGMLIGMIGVLLSAVPASAHAALVSSDPNNGVIVPDAPNKVTLTFSESIQLISGKIRVLAPDGSRADQGDPTADGSQVTIPLRSGGGRGTYLVTFRVISADSHPVAGTITYSVGAASTPPAADEIEDVKVDPVVRALIPIGKYLGYAGLVLLVGPVLVLALLWPQRLARRGPGRLIWTGIGLVAGSTVLGIWLQAPYTLGTTLFDVRVGDLRDVLGSTFGAVMLVRLAVVIAAGFLLRPLLVGSGGESKLDLALLGVLGVAALATWPLTGHPTASPVPGVSVVLDALHLASMSVWLGGLVMLFAFLLPQANARELGAILPIWSRWAFTAVGALIFAGTVQALIEVSSLNGLFNSTYGRLILTKVALAAIVIAVAAYSRRLVNHKIAEESPRGLRRVLLAELGITAVVLGVTAALVQIAPPRTAEAAQTTETSTTVTQTLTDKNMSLQVDIYPAAVGNNSMHLYAYTPDNKPLPVVEWKATAALPAKGIEPIEIPLLRITDFHAIGDIALPQAGEWTFKFTARTTDIDQTSFTMTAKIS
ncbi:copper resistance CopC/CopD family protein [Actinoplanes awajinensis]|uniref:Copper resistance protein CopC n=1 Tax=Actinoplanes awajinensis subsp. mycoplanecinus TaxID=135947 RepID=A0A101JIA6_9ACTN|nr:copper resistance protein CopC [Actinoplanes awajinensis]KUL27314.1 copper resistance protein CopC [Actinoplanes awajinensis subsp. mycoplanecinus]